MKHNLEYLRRYIIIVKLNIVVVDQVSARIQLYVQTIFYFKIMALLLGSQLSLDDFDFIWLKCFATIANTKKLKVNTPVCMCENLRDHRRQCSTSQELN